MKSAYKLYVDGAARGNPGLAGAGALLLAADGSLVEEVTEFLGKATNNVAEYRALIAGMQAALRLNIKELQVFSDSELVVKQILGIYRIKHPDLKPLAQQVFDLKKQLQSFSIEHVRREFNKEADKLANRAIDMRSTAGDAS